MPVPKQAVRIVMLWWEWQTMIHDNLLLRKHKIRSTLAHYSAFPTLYRSFCCWYLHRLRSWYRSVNPKWYSEWYRVSAMCPGVGSEVFHLLLPMSSLLTASPLCAGEGPPVFCARSGCDVTHGNAGDAGLFNCCVFMIFVFKKKVGDVSKYACSISLEFIAALFAFLDTVLSHSGHIWNPAWMCFGIRLTFHQQLVTCQWTFVKFQIWWNLHDLQRVLCCHRRSKKIVNDALFHVCRRLPNYVGLLQKYRERRFNGHV